MFIFTVLFMALAIAVQARSIIGIGRAVARLKGAIRDERDLQLVRRTINMNIQLAIMYIVIGILYAFALLILIFNGVSLGSAAINLLIFIAVTLPVGLYGRGYEKRIKQLKMENNDSKIAARFLDYLTQWLEPRWRISDRDVN